MHTFDWLVVGHLIGDYLLQTEFEAMNKASGKFLNRALISHCLKYSAVFVPLFHFQAVSLYWLVLVFGSHMVLDRRWPIIWWRKHITKNSDDSIKNTFWLTIVLDQIFHILILVGIETAH